MAGDHGRLFSVDCVMFAQRFLSMAAGAVLALLGTAGGTKAADVHAEPWRDKTRALVLDAYEYNEIDWQEVVTDRRVAGFIGKATDGLPPEYGCKDKAEKTEFLYCRLAWRRYVLSKELYQTRRAVAKALGLKWGAYHMARPGNPAAQADHFLDFTKPEPDELIALDIEDNDPREFLSLEDAEIFVRRIRQRTGRYPVLYTNGSTAKHIADNHRRYPLLSRLKLWYARYKPDIDAHFPKGNWQSYTLWQFASHINCGKRSCPYRVPGTNRDIDVNVSPLTVAQLRHQWPFGGLLPVTAIPQMQMAEVPLPITRDGRHGGALAYTASLIPVSVQMKKPAPRFLDLAGTAELFARLKDIAISYRQRLTVLVETAPVADALQTASIARDTIKDEAQNVAAADICLSENVGQAFQWTGEHAALGRNHNRPLDQHRIGRHGMDKLVIGQVGIVEAKLGVEGALLADQVARRNTDRCDEFTQLSGIGRRLQVFDDLGLVPGLADGGQRLARGGTCRIVVDGDAHSPAPSSRATARHPISVR